MAEILNFTGKSLLHSDPDQILDLLKTQLLDVVVVGWKKEDSSLIMATSEPKASEVIYLLTLAEKTILNKVYNLV